MRYSPSTSFCVVSVTSYGNHVIRMVIIFYIEGRFPSRNYRHEYTVNHGSAEYSHNCSTLYKLRSVSSTKAI